MPQVGPILNPNQVTPNGNPPSVNQQNFGQMIGEVSDANPDMDPTTISVRLNGIIRKVYDRRPWYGLMVRGQIPCVGQVVGGTVNITNGSPTVIGTGTNWTAAIINRQFRIGYNTDRYTITALDVPTQTITLEMPWAGTTYTGAGYIITQSFFEIPNIKYIHSAKNLIMAWRLRLDLNQQSLDQLDPWRIQIFSPRALAQMSPAPNGNYRLELWPSPAIVQGLPYMAAVQPPNLVNDGDSLAPYIRSDIITKLGRADALVYRGPKVNKYYDIIESQRLRSEAEDELERLALTDENLYRQNLIYEWEQMPMAPLQDGYWAVNHGVMAGDGDGGAGWNW